MFDLRNATVNDLKRIIELEINGYDPGNREDFSVYEERINIFPQGSLIASISGKPIGCMFSEIWDYKEFYTDKDFSLGHNIKDKHNERTGTELYISSITVDEHLNGNGVGTKLFLDGINRILKQYRQITSIVLLINEKWNKAYHIYEKSGFIKTQTLHNFFEPYPGQKEDGFVMRKIIKQ